MNILFITQDDPFYIKVFFENILKHYPSANGIKGVVLCETMGKGKVKLAMELYGFYGLKDFMKMGFRFVKCKILGSLCSLFRIKRFYDLRTVLKFYNIPILELDNINGKEFLNDIKKYDLDLIISVACPKIFKNNLLSIPKHGCINIHTAKLPNYRGMMPNFWNMFNDEKETGITIHKMNSGIDEGEIVFQRNVVIKPEESLDTLIKRTKKIGAEAMIEILTQFKEGTVKYKENDYQKGSYYSFPTNEHVKEFRRRGKRLL